MSGLVNRLGVAEDEPIQAKILTGQIENAQKRIEGRNYEIRKNVLQYDDVMNEQRKEIYAQRRQVLDGENMRESILKMTDLIIDEAMDTFCGAGDVAMDWDMKGLSEYMVSVCLDKAYMDENLERFAGMDRADIAKTLKEKAHEVYAEREEAIGQLGLDMREVERVILLGNVDRQWMAHIDDMDQLRDGIGLRAFANRNPIQEYQIEGYAMFDEMVHRIRESTVRQMFRARFVGRQERQEVARPQETNLEQAKNAGGKAAPKRVGKRVGRNDPCPCGSGKKFKNCCGRDL
jgi:preprotein translocase subunit SecA